MIVDIIANQQINIEVGDTVEWTWVGGGNHNLVSTWY